MQITSRTAAWAVVAVLVAAGVSALVPSAEASRSQPAASGAFVGRDAGARVGAPSIGDTDIRPWPLTREGDSGVTVKALQVLLNAAGGRIVVDGRFGPRTVRAVKDFQRRQLLVVDGVVGPETWPALAITQGPGDGGGGVVAVQMLLNAAGGNGLIVDGWFGPDTTAAVKDFQRRHDLTVDGVVGPGTWPELLHTARD